MHRNGVWLAFSQSSRIESRNWRPRRELNPDLPLRRGPLYPFNYRGAPRRNDTLAGMNPQTIGLVFAGAGAGGVARLLLNHWLNPVFLPLPLGTLTANVLGSGAAGALLGLLGARADLDPVLRPLLIVGFLGGLTTFSTFSLEVVQALEQQRAWLATGIALLHVCASVAAAIAGLVGMRALLA